MESLDVLDAGSVIGLIHQRPLTLDTTRKSHDVLHSTSLVPGPSSSIDGNTPGEVMISPVRRRFLARRAPNGSLLAKST